MSHPHFGVEISEAVRPLVLAVDIGSTASRGCLFDAHGRPAGHRHKVPHSFGTSVDGASVIDADSVLGELKEIVDALLDQPGVGSVAAVGLDTFASSLVGVDGLGRALTPCYTYADARCGAAVEALRSELDEAVIQQRTGTRLHASYLPARLRWLHDTDPRRFAHVHRWLSLGEYLHLHLLGETAAGTSVAAWSGLLNRRTGTWDEELLDVSGVRRDQLSPILDPDHTIDSLDPWIGDRWPQLADAVWFPALADGLAANFGTGASDPRTVAASCATSGALRVVLDGIPESIPPGLWCYRIDRNRSLLGGATNDVGRVVRWLSDTLKLPAEAALDGVLRGEPSPHTPLVLPFLTGERAIGWAVDARAVFTGVSLGTGPTEFVRGAMEGVALVYARIAGQLAAEAPDVHRIVASGRVSQDLPGLLQLMADAMGKPVVPITIKRATLHGTALSALETVAPGLERTPPLEGPVLEPKPSRAQYYAERRAEFERVYAGVI